jgi:hypothetical protein
MIPFLPAPQELRYTGAPFQAAGGEQLFFSPWKGEDAAEGVLRAALKTLGLSRAALGAALPETDGATLVVAVDSATARKLARRALAGLDETIPTPTVCHDGPCFADETTQGRRAAAAFKPDASDEEYSLQITPAGIAIAGRSRRALFWGVQTLCQVLEYSRREKARAAPGLLIRDWPTQRVRGLHLDMKYLLARPAVIEDWLRQLAAWKINTILFEYEDKFPYERHRFLRHESAMTPAQLRRVLDTARQHHIQVVPLIQTLGHLEYCLKHEELAHLREMPDILFQINPLNPDARRFVLEMIDEVMAYHPDAEYFHVGGDETWFLGANPQSREMVERKGEIGIYLDYMLPVLEHVILAGKRPVLWDDILREQADKCDRIPRETVLGYWDYSPVREKHAAREVPDALRRAYQLDGKRPALWPDTLSIFPFFDYYRQQGFDVLSIPCCNYGTLVPDDAHNAPNTLKFAEKAAVCGGLGTINSQWASFKMPFDVMWHPYALTAQSAWLFPPADLTDFDSVFSRSVLGEASGALVQATRLIAEGVGFRAPAANRMLNLLHFAIMDSELNFDGGIRERQKKGSAIYELDFARIVQRKLKALDGLKAKPDVLARLIWVEAQMDAALHLLDGAQPSTPRGQNVRELLRAGARFKRVRAGTMRLLMSEASPFKTPRAALCAEAKSRAEMTRLYGRTLAKADREFEMRLLFEGEIAALRVLDGEM